MRLFQREKSRKGDSLRLAPPITPNVSASRYTTLNPSFVIEDVFKDPEAEFTLVEKLGEGSYGSVWKAHQKQTGDLYAVKVIRVEAQLTEVRKEVDIMKQCKHPNIVSYYGSYFKDCDLWIIMEYCSVGSCSDLMKICKRTFSEDQIRFICKEILQGLDYLHSMKKLHRDIKAGNILINQKGECKLADFGVSGQLTDTMSRTNTMIGTPFWMAPEVIQQSGYSTKIDIWSLGITVIELAQGAPPLSEIHPMRAIFLIPTRPPPTLSNPSLWSQELGVFLARCLCMNPAGRPAAADLLEDPFITSKSVDASCILPMAKEQEHIITTEGRERALGLNDLDTSSQVASVQQLQTSTMESEGPVTVVIDEDSVSSQFPTAERIKRTEHKDITLLREKLAALKDREGVLDIELEEATVKVSSAREALTKLSSDLVDLKRKASMPPEDPAPIIAKLEQELQVAKEDKQRLGQSIPYLEERAFWSTASAVKLQLKLEGVGVRNILIEDLWKVAKQKSVQPTRWSRWLAEQLDPRYAEQAERDQEKSK